MMTGKHFAGEFEGEDMEAVEDQIWVKEVQELLSSEEKPSQQNQQLFHFGGPGSGHHGHSGRPGEVGGSQRGEGFMLAGSTVYRSTSSARKEGLPGKHFAISEKVAKQYGGSVEAYEISGDANIVNFSSEEAQPVVSLWGVASDKEIREEAHKLGIHGIYYDFDPSGKFGIVIFDESKARRVE